MTDTIRRLVMQYEVIGTFEKTGQMRTSAFVLRGDAVEFCESLNAAFSLSDPYRVEEAPVEVLRREVQDG